MSYDDNNAYLNLILNFAVPSGLTGNQQNVGNALTNFFNTTGGIPLAFGALSPQGLTQVSGETATGTQQTTFDAMTQFMGVMTDPFVAGRGEGGFGATGYADEQALSYAQKRKPNDALAAIYTKAPPRAPSFAQRWSVWAAGYGGSQTTDGNAGVGSNTATSRIFGTAVGADYRFSPDTLAGFALAGGGTNFSVANGGSGPFRPVPGRRIRPPHGRSGLYLRRTRLRLAGHHHRSHRHHRRRRSVARKVQRQCLLRPRRRRLPLRHAGDAGSRLTPPDSSPPSICPPMPNRRCPAPTPLR